MLRSWEKHPLLDLLYWRVDPDKLDLSGLAALLPSGLLPLLERLLDGGGHAASPYSTLTHISHFSVSLGSCNKSIDVVCLGQLNNDSYKVLGTLQETLLRLRWLMSDNNYLENYAS